EGAPIAVLQGLEEQPRCQTRLTHAGRADEDDVLGAVDEVEAGERADLTAGDARLPLEGKSLERPLFGQPRSSDPPSERRLLLGVPLGAHESEYEVLVRGLLFVGPLQLLFEDLEDLPESQSPEQLLELVAHDQSPSSSEPGPGKKSPWMLRRTIRSTRSRS